MHCRLAVKLCGGKRGVGRKRERTAVNCGNRERTDERKRQSPRNVYSVPCLGVDLRSLPKGNFYLAQVASLCINPQVFVLFFAQGGAWGRGAEVSGFFRRSRFIGGNWEGAGEGKDKAHKTFTPYFVLVLTSPPLRRGTESTLKQG